MTLAYYLDTSALAKLYIQESGTDWMQRLLQCAQQEGLLVENPLNYF